eukprot:scaffold4743_cov171-Amphora_coffeaeformis.AAC.2
MDHPTTFGSNAAKRRMVTEEGNQAASKSARDGEIRIPNQNRKQQHIRIEKSHKKTDDVQRSDSDEQKAFSSDEVPLPECIKQQVPRINEKEHTSIERALSGDESDVLASDVDSVDSSHHEKRAGLRHLVQKAANKTSQVVEKSVKNATVGVKLVARRMGSVVSNKNGEEFGEVTRHTPVAGNPLMNKDGASSKRDPECIIDGKTAPQDVDFRGNKNDSQHDLSPPQKKKKSKFRTIATKAGKATHPVGESPKNVAECVKSVVSDRDGIEIDGDRVHLTVKNTKGKTGVLGANETGVLSPPVEKVPTASKVTEKTSNSFICAAKIKLALILAATTVTLVYQWNAIRQDQIPLWVCLVFVGLSFALGQLFPFAQETLWVSKDLNRISPLMEQPSIPPTDSKVVCVSNEVLSAGALNRRAIRKPFSSLNAKHLFKWQMVAPAPIGDRKNALMRRLARNKSLRRRRRSRIAEVETLALVRHTPSLAKENRQRPLASHKMSMGEYDGSSVDNSLVDYVVEPLCQMRGFDIFLTEECPSDVGTHPWLIRQGLRNAPTFCGNIMTQWGNILMYFAMPDWVQDFEAIFEEEIDPQEVKAFKRFLIGDDDYRNNRFNVIPSLADGPLPMKILAPAKKREVDLRQFRRPEVDQAQPYRRGQWAST